MLSQELLELLVQEKSCVFVIGEETTQIDETKGAYVDLTKVSSNIPDWSAKNPVQWKNSYKK